jgi:hypothetical protein
MNERIEELMLQSGYDPFYLSSLKLENLIQLIIEECAKIAEDCYSYHEPLSKVPQHIKKFERLTDENMRHKL